MHLTKLFYQSIIWRALYFITAFALNILIARYYKASYSGELFYLINFYALIILLLSFSLESAISFYISKNEILLNKLINFALAWTAIIAIIVVIFFNFYRNELKSPNSLMFAFTFISGNVLSSYCTAIFYAKRDFFLPNLIFVVFNFVLLSLLLSIDFLPTFFITKETFLFLFFSSFLLQALLLVFVLQYKYVNKYDLIVPTLTELKKIFRFGLTAFFANILFFLLCRIDYWFVKIYCDNAALGNYIQVSKIAQIFFILPSTLSALIFPLIAGASNKKINTRFIILVRLLFLFYICCCLFLVLTGKWLFPYVFGNSFSHMYEPYLYLIPGILSLPGLYIITAYFSGRNMIIVNISGTLLSLVLVIIFDFLFIPYYGIEAAALISSSGYFIYLLYVLIKFKKEQEIRFRDFVLIKTSDIHLLKNIFKKSGVNNIK